MLEESLAPILPHAIQTICSKTCIKDILRQLKLYDVYKRNLNTAQKNFHRPNSIKYTYTFFLTYIKNIGQIQGLNFKTNQPILG